MQNITESQRTKQGCFVYQITSDVGVRSSPNVGDDNRTDVVYFTNDLVSLDLILPSVDPNSKNGPFLRLSDNSGWLFEKKHGEVTARRLPVVKGLWAFYVEDTGTGGIQLRANPNGLRVPYYDTVYEPMQLIYCDRQVTSPVTNIASYRVQGTHGWLTEKGEDGTVFLLPENKVKTGLFAYELASDSVPSYVLKMPSISGGALPLVPFNPFNKGEVITCDVIRQSLNNKGTFLHLSDGCGWILVHQMHQIPIVDGNWTLVVMNSVGVAMRRLPIDRQDCKTSTLFNPGEMVRCDKKIKSTQGTTFYRVAGKEGWVFDNRGDDVMMRVYATSARGSTLSNNDDEEEGWSIEFVRGMAAAFELKEIMINEGSRVISFQTDANERINVYYTTRTVGTALNHPSQGATQLFRRRCSNEELREIMQNPRVHTGKGYKKRPKIEERANRSGYSEVEYIDEEADYRNKLIEHEKEEEKMAEKKLMMLKKLKVFDDERAKHALEMKIKKDARTHEFEEAERQRQEANRQIQQAREAAEQRQRCTCHVCHQVFVNVHAKNQHFQAVHVFQCDYCYKEFSSMNALNQHKNATYHW